MKSIDADYSEVLLLPPSVEDWVPSDHPARFIRELVGQMDLSHFNNGYQKQRTGRPSYSPQLMLRIWLFGYFRRIYSTRKLEQACRESLPFVWLCGNNVPDHCSLWRFFDKNQKHIRNFFKCTVKIAREMDLVSFVLHAVDGTKISAACSTTFNTHKDNLEKLYDLLDKQIDSIEEGLKHSHKKERRSQAHLPSELKDRQRLKDRISEALDVINKEEGLNYCNPQEPDSRMMKGKGKNEYAYNAQAVVDEQEQIICGADVLNDVNDFRALTTMINEAQSITEQSAEMTVADGGYCSSTELTNAAQQGHNVLVNIHGSSKNKDNNPYHTSQFPIDPNKDIVICPQGKDLSFVKSRIRRGVEEKFYGNRKACKECPVRNQCTKSKHGRQITLTEGSVHISEMKKKLLTPVNQQRIRKRKQIVEPVFAQIKQNANFRRWTMKGLENVKAQWLMLCCVWNLKKIYVKWKRQITAYRTVFRINIYFYELFGAMCV